MAEKTEEETTEAAATGRVAFEGKSASDSAEFSQWLNARMQEYAEDFEWLRNH